MHVPPIDGIDAPFEVEDVPRRREVALARLLVLTGEPRIEAVEKTPPPAFR